MGEKLSPAAVRLGEAVKILGVLCSLQWTLQGAEWHSGAPSCSKTDALPAAHGERVVGTEAFAFVAFFRPRKGKFP